MLENIIPLIELENQVEVDGKNIIVLMEDGKLKEVLEKQIKNQKYLNLHTCY